MPKRLILILTLVLWPWTAFASPSDKYHEYCDTLIPVDAVWDMEYEKLTAVHKYLADREARKAASNMEKVCLATILYMRYMFWDEALISDLTESNRLLSEVFRDEPGNSYAHAQLAFNSLVVNEPRKAEEFFKKAEKGLVNRDKVMILRLKLKEALGECDWISQNGRDLTLKSNNIIRGETHAALAECAMNEGNTGFAERQLRSKSMRLPYYGSFIAYADLLIYMEQWDKAIAVAEKAIQRRTWPRGLQTLSRALVGKGKSIIQETQRYDVGLSYLEYAAKYDPHNLEALLTIAETYLTLTERSLGVPAEFEQYKAKTLSFVQAAKALDPNNARAGQVMDSLRRFRL